MTGMMRRHSGGIGESARRRGVRRGRRAADAVAAVLVLIAVAMACGAGRKRAFVQLVKGTRDFDGRSDVVEVTLPEEVRGLAQVTVGGWIYPRVPKGAVWNRYILTEPYRLDLEMASNSEDAGVLDTMGPLAGSLYTQNADGGWSMKRVVSGGPLEADRWSHVAMTYDQKMLRLFVDGEEVAAREETGALSEDRRTTRAAVGCLASWWQNSEFWAGLLRDVRMYDRGLSAQEIAKLASRRPAAPPTTRVFRSDGPPVWVLNGGLEGEYKNDKARAFPPQWYGSIWGKAKGRWKKETNYAHSGEAVLMIECDALPVGGISFYQGARLPMVPGRTYILSAWMRSDFDVDVVMGINAGGPAFDKRIKAVRRWQKYTMRKTYTGVTSSGFVIFYYASMRSGNLVIDDIELTVED